MPGQPQHLGRGLGLAGAHLDQPGALVHAGLAPLVARRADHEVHLRPLVGPPGQRPGTRDLGVVGMGVDGQHPARTMISGSHGPRLDEVMMAGWGTSSTNWLIWPSGRRWRRPPCCGKGCSGPRSKSRRSPPARTWSPRWIGRPSASSWTPSWASGATTECWARKGPIVPGTSGVRWVIDPLDGTTNYLYRHPGFAVSIAAEQDGRAVAGVVVDVPTGDVFRATRDGGATRNGTPIHVSDETDLHQALVATGFGYRPDQRRQQAAVLALILDQIRDIRRMGSAALDLCSVACGRVDAYYELSPVAVGLRRRRPHRHRGRRPRGGPGRRLPHRRAPPGRSPGPGRRPPAAGQRRAADKPSLAFAENSGSMGRWALASWPWKTTSASARPSRWPSRTRAGPSRRPTTARTRSTCSTTTPPTWC